MNLSEAVAITREEFGKSDAIRDAGRKTPEDIIRYDDLEFANGNLLDVYRPRNRGEENGKPEKLPVIVNVHGGGWVYGSKEVYQFYGMNLAQRGFAFVNPNYRLAPENAFPAQIVDVDAAFVWVKENGEAYGLDTENVFLVGDSAGGHLGAMYAEILTNPDYCKLLETNFFISFHKPLALKGVALNCGVYDIQADVEKSKGTSNTRNLIREALTESRDDPDMRHLISPNFYVTENFPPAFVMTAEKDFLKYQAPLMEAALLEKGVPVVSKVYTSSERELFHVFHCNISLPEADVCNREETDFFFSLI